MSKLLIASLLAFGAAGAASAQVSSEHSAVEERNVYLFTPDGRMIRMRANDDTHAMIMKSFKPVASGTIFYRSGGKLYMATDTKLDTGKMMHEAIFGTYYPY
jgi:hypothetical protein